MLPAATISRAVRAGTLCVKDTPLAFAKSQNLGRLLATMALAEFVIDKLPMTPSRKMAAAFGARILSGALAGAAIGTVTRRPTLGALLGIAGGIVGTEGGAAFRSWLSSLFARDLPAAVIEDLIALALIGFVSSKLKDCAVPAEASLA
jgi:uncharacterized membrane protein